MATFVEKWVEEQAKIFSPDKIYWCDGSEDEARRLVEIGLKEEKINGQPVFTPLNHKTYPNAYYHRSHPTDVARTEHLTFICHPNKEQAGANNNWMAPKEAKELMTDLSKGAMKGRTMYVLPYTMGHPDSPYAKPCIQVTDSVYVAVSMRIMTRKCKSVIERIGDSDKFVRGAHSIGDLSPERRYIMHFPQESFVWSIGSGYGGNALLGKKCIALRIASYQGFQEGWLAEHMVILGIEDPQGKVSYVAAAMPSACGKTNLAMLESTLPGYKVWMLGDDIAWLNVGEDGKMYAINPEAGLFGVAPGTSMKSNPNMMRTLKAGKFFPTLFTNTAINTDTNEPWWEGLDGEVPQNVTDWQGKPWSKEMDTKACQPNARFTVAAVNVPTLSKEYNNPKGVPISAIIFGGRRSHLIPLVCEAKDWQAGVFMGARVGSETTAAAIGKEGVLRRDPMAMLPFCGYNMGDYFGHWLNVGKKMKNPPKIFSVNWFRVNEAGKFIWPGFGDNIRVLKWILERVENKVDAVKTPVGLLPHAKDIDLNGLNISETDKMRLFSIDKQAWLKEMQGFEEFTAAYGNKMPQAMHDEAKKITESL
jgi:phosphoenolpyruvate carboxykinase (GTP)